MPHVFVKVSQAEQSGKLTEFYFNEFPEILQAPSGDYGTLQYLHTLHVGTMLMHISCADIGTLN